MHSRSVYVPFCLLGAAVAGSASAHHSNAMFDLSKTVTLSGSVLQFQWTNPHSYIQLAVANSSGREQEWSLEMGAPIYLKERGWSRTSLKAGDRVTAAIAPLRNGGNGGLVVRVERANGERIGSVR